MYFRLFWSPKPALRIFLGIEYDRNSAPSFGDSDGDGDLDLVVGNGNGKIKYFENNGAGAFGEQVGKSSPFNGVDVGLDSKPIFVDYDGDGDVDVIVGNYDGKLRYFENNGDGTYDEKTGGSNPLDNYDDDSSDDDDDGSDDSAAGSGAQVCTLGVDCRISVVTGIAQSSILMLEPGVTCGDLGREPAPCSKKACIQLVHERNRPAHLRVNISVLVKLRPCAYACARAHIGAKGRG